MDHYWSQYCHFIWWYSMVYMKNMQLALLTTGEAENDIQKHSKLLTQSKLTTVTTNNKQKLVVALLWRTGWVFWKKPRWHSVMNGILVPTADLPACSWELQWAGNYALLLPVSSPLWRSGEDSLCRDDKQASFTKHWYKGEADIRILESCCSV